MFHKDKNYDNSKKILCFNMLNKQKCNYGAKCMYAHNLSEQQIEPLRHKVYTIIKCTNDLTNMDLINDNCLYETMLQLTRVCSSCNKGLCPGGYNCRNGVFNAKLKICFEDLVYGNCKRVNCQAVHLTDRGLIPYIKQKNKDKINNLKKSINKDYNIKDDGDKKEEIDKIIRIRNIDYDKITSLKKDLDNVKGILLTDNFLITHLGKNLIKDASDSDSLDEEDTNAMLKFFESSNENSDDESIFLV